MTNFELATLIDNCTKSKNQVKNVKDTTLRVLIEAIIKSKQSKSIIKELVQ